MSVFAHPRFLRTVFLADAASGAGTALLHLAAAGALAGWLGLPAALLSGSGMLLLLFVALAGYLSLCDPVPRPLAWALVAGNVAWVLACVGLLAGAGGFTPGLLGSGYLLVQAVAVGALAALQWAGLRRVAVAGWA